MAELLFHGVSTGAGVQTLGEEYCDILQVAGEPNAAAPMVAAHSAPQLRHNRLNFGGVAVICCLYAWGIPSPVLVCECGVLHAAGLLWEQTACRLLRIPHLSRL